jgi:hypothetical protein
MQTDQQHMAELLSARGPMQGAEIRGALDWDMGRIRDAVRGEPAWFLMTPSGWNLTAYGRAEMGNAEDAR